MKKIIGLCLLIFVLTLSGCAEKDKLEKQNKQTNSKSKEKESIINVFQKNIDLENQKIKKFSKDIKPEPGYEIFSVLASHNKNKVVYTEVKGEFIGPETGWQYRVIYKDIENGDKKTIYSFPKNLSAKKGFIDNFIKPVMAGECLTLPFPFKWTRNDKKIIFKRVSLSNCSLDSLPGFEYFLYDFQDDLKPLHYITFLNDFSQALILESGEKTLCNSMQVPINEKVFAKDIESGEKIDITPDQGYHYRYLGLNKKLNVLLLERLKFYYNRNKGCYEFVSKGERVEIDLKNINK